MTYRRRLRSSPRRRRSRSSPRRRRSRSSPRRRRSRSSPRRRSGSAPRRRSGSAPRRSRSAPRRRRKHSDSQIDINYRQSMDENLKYLANNRITNQQYHSKRKDIENKYNRNYYKVRDDFKKYLQ